MQTSKYGLSNDAKVVERLLDEVEEQIRALEVNHPESVRPAAILQRGDMTFARQAAMALNNQSEQDGMLSISYSQEARIKYFFLSYDDGRAKREALDCIQKAINLLPNPYYHFIQASIHADLGERDKAIQSLETAVELGGSTQEEMQDELIQMKRRFALEDSIKSKKSTDLTPKEESQVLGGCLTKYSSIIMASSFVLSYITDFFKIEFLSSLFVMVFIFSWIGIFSGIFFWIKSFFVK